MGVSIVCEGDFDIAEPRADAMIQSLRAFGYDLTTAIADLIDNSISAGAKNVWLRFHWSGDASWIYVRDDGNGMAEGDLVNAMRPGSENPLTPRSVKDLGRFGLGLKTASFSQCKRLIVRSKGKKSTLCTRCWDLDVVTETCQWRLLRTIPPETEAKLADFDDQDHGTIVLWESMDRLVEGNQTENRTQQDRFYQRVEQVSEHIAMVFHRFLEGPKSLSFWVNGDRVRPWNPFLPREAATQSLPEEPLQFNDASIAVAPYVLPHHSRMGAETFKRAGGSRGWNDLQGFYVYRNGRMLVAGDWLGLGFQKEEHCKLARIQLDISNAMDMDWQIDVRKARARPPAAIREELKRIARLTRGKAVEVYRSRGKILSGPRNEQTVFLWSTLRRNGHNRYIINREHPAVKSVGEALTTDGPVRLTALLRLIEETLPVKSGPNSGSPSPGDTRADDFDISQLAEILRDLFGAMVSSGKPVDRAIEILSIMEPFDRYPELIASLEDGGRQDADD